MAYAEKERVIIEPDMPRWSAAWWCEGEGREWMAHLWDNVALCVAIVWGAEGDRWPDADWRGYAERCAAKTS